MALLIEKSPYYFGVPARVPGVVGLEVRAFPDAFLTARATFMIEDAGDVWKLHLVAKNRDGSVFVNSAVEPFTLPK